MKEFFSGDWLGIKTWKQVPGHPKYFASRCGKIYSTYSNRELAYRKHLGGYGCVGLDGRTYTAHKVITLTFLGPRTSAKIEVNHINGNKIDNRIENLEYTTRKLNDAHARRIGLTASVTNAKLNNRQVRRIKQLLAGAQPTCFEISKAFDVCASTVSAIKRGDKWKNIK